METIGKILALVFMFAFCVSACWVNWMKGKARRDREYEAKYRRARAMLKLSDEVVVIQEPRTPELAELEVQCRRFKQSLPERFREDTLFLRDFQERMVKEADGVSEEG